jgi:hypothetical protein
MNDASETRITLRLPAWLRDDLAASAERTNRSMNGEIVDRLIDSIEMRQDVTTAMRHSKALHEEMMSILFSLLEEVAETGGRFDPGSINALRKAMAKSLPDWLFEPPFSLPRYEEESRKAVEEVKAATPKPEHSTKPQHRALDI